jgi:hypothetical protein
VFARVWKVFLAVLTRCVVCVWGGGGPALLLTWTLTIVQKYSPTWHCIVGRNFGSYVTHETKHFIYFYLGQVAILLFKSG